MDSSMLLKVLAAIFETFFLFGIGALALRLKYIRPQELAGWGKLAIDVLFPFCAFSGVVGGFDASDRSLVWLPPLLGFGIIAFNTLCGLGLQYGLRDRAAVRMRTFRHLAAVNNYVFLPLIIIQNIYGVKGVGCLMLMSLGSAAGFWSCGIAVMAGNDFKEAMRNLLSPNMAAVALALYFVISGTPVPSHILTVTHGIGAAATPLALILIGASLFHSGARLFSGLRDAAYTICTRLLILPFLTVLLLKLLPLPEFIYNVALIVALMPASCASVLIVRKYGGCADFAGQAVFLSTVFSPLSIMLLLGVLN